MISKQQNKQIISLKYRGEVQGMDKIIEGDQEVQFSGYKINNSWR